MSEHQPYTAAHDAGELDTFYGVRSWHAWIEARPDDLSPWKAPGATVERESPFRVASYGELLRVVSFLNVMNKNHHLLFRGQSREWPLLPSVLRGSWTPPLESGLGDVAPGSYLSHYLEQLDRVRNSVVDLLVGEKRLPRWRPFQYRRMAAWAVIQHYGIWPTPLLDLTSSLRVAASFALGLRNDMSQGRSVRQHDTRSGLVYVLGVRELLSDFMDLDENSPRMQALRLNSVCPPDAARPHFQEGFLLTWPQLGTQGQGLDTEARANSRLIAKFLLIDNGRFWSNDFPEHTQASLLPGRDRDELLREFRELITYQLDGERLVAVSA